MVTKRLLSFKLVLCSPTFNVSDLYCFITELQYCRRTELTSYKNNSKAI